MENVQMSCEWRKTGGSNRCRERWVAAIWLVTLAAMAALPGSTSRSLCPSRCICDDALRAASCVDAALEDVPIQLNPEAAYINLTRNRIQNVLFTLRFYTDLSTLDISHNRIENLGSKNFEYNSKMLHLNISNNGVEALEKNTFTGLNALISLDLCSNRISIVNYHAFRDMNVLEELKLSNNLIVSFEYEVFQPLVNLRLLLLENNQFLDIPTDNLMHVLHLEHLSLSGNLIVNITESAAPFLKRMRVLDLAENLISGIHHSALEGMVALQYLNLNDNNLTVVPTAALSKLTNLTHLSLNGNYFDAMPPVSFQSLFHLRHLHLSRLEKLTKIDVRAFVDNINLEKIWMNDNIQVVSLPTRIFHGNPRLTQISVKNNDIFTLHASHFPLDQLQSLQIGGNPFHCNCSLLWLWKLGQEHLKQPLTLNNTDYSNLFIDFSNIFCASPENLENAVLIRVPESTIRCSMGWITVLTIVLSLSLLISIAGSILYYIGALKRCTKEKSKHVMTDSDLTGDLPKMSNGLMYGTNHQRPDDKMDINRYLMIAPGAADTYHSTPPWHTMNKAPINGDTMESMYQPFGYESIPCHKTMDRPHIVYV